MSAEQMNRSLEGVPVPDDVYLPPAVVADKPKRRKKDKTIAEKRDRIAEECDPLGALIALANGQPVASVHIKDGKTEVKFETANLATRIKILEGLRLAVVPNLSMNQPKEKPQEPEENAWDALTRRRSAGMVEGESS